MTRWQVVTPHPAFGWQVGDVIRLHPEGDRVRITLHRELPAVDAADIAATLAAVASSALPAPLPSQQTPPPPQGSRARHLRLVG